jgi:hypothetical protein
MSMLPIPRVLALPLCAALAGCVAEAPSFETDEAEIINGVPTSDYPSVVRVFGAGVTQITPTTPSCTGVLITSSSVLTAAHCVVNGGVHVTDLFTGTAVTHPTLDLAVVSTFDKKGRLFRARMAVNLAAGWPITLVGFGSTGPASPQDGIKRMGTNTIDSFDGSLFYYDTDLVAPAPTEAATCYGDSGGPAFFGTTNCIVGVTKGQLGNGAYCTAAAGAWIHTRTDVDLAWIEAVTRDPVAYCDPL